MARVGGPPGPSPPPGQPEVLGWRPDPAQQRRKAEIDARLVHFDAPGTVQRIVAADPSSQPEADAILGSLRAAIHNARISPRSTPWTVTQPLSWEERLALTRLRRLEERARTAPPPPPSSPSSAEPVVAPELEKAKVKTKQLRTEVATKERQSKSATRRRAAIALHKEGKTPKEIGGELGISPITVRGYIRDRERDTKTLISSKAAKPGRR
jgi:hypothetical protein